MSNLPNFVVIEGVDGVGKTTLAKLLAERNDYTYFYTLPEPLSSIRKQVENLRDFNFRFYYYLAAIVAAQIPLRKLLDAGSKIVVDRYVYSTFAMHQALGVSTEVVNFDQMPIIWPDCGIVLCATPSVRTTRQGARPVQADHDRHIEQSSKILDIAQNIFRGFNGLTEIETSRSDIETVYQQTLSLFRGLRC